MNLDILSTTYGQTTFNIKLAHIVGLKTALYWSVLVDALFQAKKKNKVSEDGYFVLDRKYVYAMTTLTTPEQKECEKILTSLGYLENGTKTNSIRVDVGGIVKLITDDDEKQIEQIKNLVSKIVDVDKDAQKAEGISKNLKSRITETDLDIAEALYGWVDSLEGKANGKTVEIFQAELNKYTRDKKVKLELIRRATVMGYRDISWVINAYEREVGKTSNSKPVAPPRNVATSKADVNFNTKF
jgi:hypothetical protein